MLRSLAALRSLPAAERRTLFALAFALPLIEASLRVAGMQRTEAWISRAVRPAPLHAASPAEMSSAERLARLAAIAGGRGPVASLCLSQSLLLRALLRRRGLDAALRIGVHKEGGVFDAHAWVELDGRALAQASTAHAPLVSSERGIAPVALRGPSDQPAAKASPGTDKRTT
jgi:hypothetical protein